MEKKDPIISLIKLNDQIIKLDHLQKRIDEARKIASGNQSIQLELDRHQSDVDNKRKLIALTMLDISSRN
jgi:hypothetical protein